MIYTFLFFIIFFQNPLNATPTFEDGFFDKEYYKKFLKVGELIYELNNVDINNNDLYEGYEFKYESNCKVKVELKPYSSSIKTFEVDLCKKKINMNKNN